MGFDLANSFIVGGDINVDLAGLTDNSDFEWSAGFSYLGRLENTRLYNENLDKLTNGYSGRMNFGKGGFYIGAEYIYKDKDALVEIQRVKPGVLQAGNAILINTGYAKKGMAIDVNMRRMENMSFYSQRDLAGNDYFKGTLNYIPGLTKQYDYSLQNIYVYQAQPNFDMEMQGKLGEIGGQFDFYYEFPKGSVLGGEYAVFMLEDHLLFRQSNSTNYYSHLPRNGNFSLDFEHNNTLVGMFNGFRGTEISSSVAKAGSEFSNNDIYMRHKAQKLENTKIVVIVTDMQGKVLNAASAKTNTKMDYQVVR